MNDYKATVGLEVHLELKTKSKIFSDSLNNYGSLPNHNINYVDLALPGTLPTVNKEAIRQGIKGALLLNSTINKDIRFDRKNYFYPDNAKNYQITQYEKPVGVNGFIDIGRKIRIHDVHIEEDTAKSIHQKKKTYLDFNRGGVPLIEIVSEPDLRSGKEAYLYLEKLRELMLYAGVSDCKIEEGSMRCDANISVSKTNKLGIKTEVKNISSLKDVELAIEYEIKRQINDLKNGVTLKEETRRYDEKAQKTVLMRVKEGADDYRYFPDSNIPYINITDEEIEEIKASLPIPASRRREIYKERGLNDKVITSLINNQELSDFLNLFLNDKVDLVLAGNLLLGDIKSYLNKKSLKLKDTKLDYKRFKIILELYEGKLNSKSFKDIIDDIMESDTKIESIIDKASSLLMSDSDISNIAREVVNENKEQVQEYKKGNERILKYLMGMMMKKSKGKIDPVRAREILMKKVDDLD